MDSLEAYRKIARIAAEQPTTLASESKLFAKGLEHAESLHDMPHHTAYHADYRDNWIYHLTKGAGFTMEQAKVLWIEGGILFGTAAHMTDEESKREAFRMKWEAFFNYIVGRSNGRLDVTHLSVQINNAFLYDSPEGGLYRWHPVLTPNTERSLEQLLA